VSGAPDAGSARPAFTAVGTPTRVRGGLEKVGACS
jgi:hypothetical protein